MRRDARHEESGVELTGVDRRRHPVGEQDQRVERQPQAFRLDEIAQRRRPTVHRGARLREPIVNGGAGKRNECAAAVAGQHHAGLLV